MTATSSVPHPDPVSTAVPLDPRALSLLLARLGVPVAAGALEQAWQSVGGNNAGLAPAHLVNRVLASVRTGRLQVAQLRWERLDRRCLPALVCHAGAWRVASTDGGDVILEDADGARAVAPAAELDGCLVLWVHKPAVADERRAPGGSPAARLLLGEILKSKRWIADATVATVVINLLAVASSLFSMQVYDRVVPTFSYATMWALVAGMALVAVLDWTLKYLRARLTDRAALRVDEAVSQRLFEHLLHLRHDARPRSVGTLAAQVSGMESVRAFFSSTIVFTLTDLPFVLLFIALIGAIGGAVGWVYALLAPVAVAVAWFAQKRLSRLAHLEVRRGHERQGMLVDAIAGAETIQSTGTHWRFAGQWRALTEMLAGYHLKSKSITSTTISTTAALSTTAYVAALAVGVTLIEAGELTTGGLIACTMLGGRVIGPITQSVQLMIQWQHVREALGMVDKLLQLETARAEGQELLAPLSLPDGLEFEGVRFAHSNSPVVALNLPQLRFAAGERVVILGPNGCGKSTLLKVAAGLYKPGEGQVRLGGADLWSLDPAVVAERVAYLPQDVHLFKGTLRSNLALAGGASDASLLEVAALLGIDRIAAENPKSMDLEISEGGQGLSGGQRQLVGLGRVFLARPRVWLLDEPSAALDMDSENRILKAIQEWVRPTDILLIATHRPRLTALANRVVVMRRGQVVADGKPDDVLKSMRPPQAAQQAAQHTAAGGTAIVQH